MSDEIQQLLEQMKVDRTNLYREETVTDLRAATIRHLIPIKVDGTQDEGRAEVFVGTTQVMSPQGPIPIQAEIPASNLDEALDAFPEAIGKSLQNMIQQAEEMRRQEESRIVVPGRDDPKIIG